MGMRDVFTKTVMKFNDVRPSCAVSYVGLSVQEKLQMSEEKNVVRRLQRRGLTDQNRRGLW
jgi:hypothetical protein